MATYKYFSYDNFLYFWQKMKLKIQAMNTKIDNKVDKVEGKGLSTNDLTDSLVEKINNAGDSSFTGDYDDLTDKPSINNVTLGGNKTLAELGIQPAGQYLTATDIANMVETDDITDVVREADIADVVREADIADMATKTYVDNSVSNLVNSAPATLDTLKELSDALGADPNFATTMTTALGNKVNTADMVALTNAEIDAIMDETQQSGS